MPTTPNYGWTYPSSSGYVKNGATDMQTIAQGIDTTLFTALGGNYPGLRLIKTQTIGTAVSTVTVTDAFSATYDNYKITITGGTPSATNSVLLTLGATATGYYNTLIYQNFATPTTLSATGNANTTTFYRSGFYTTDGIVMDCELQNPFNTKRTTGRGIWQGTLTTSDSGSWTGFLNNTTSYTAFTITAATGTWTGGTIAVYGYGKA